MTYIPKKIAIDKINLAKFKKQLYVLFRPLKIKCRHLGIKENQIEIEYKTNECFSEIYISFIGIINSESVAEFTVNISKYNENTEATIEKVDIDDIFKKKGLSTAALKIFDKLFEIFDVKQIEMTGIDEGKFVWARKKFEMSFEQPQEIRDLFYKWLSKNNKPLRYIGLKPYYYPKSFLKTLPSVKYIKKRD